MSGSPKKNHDECGSPSRKRKLLNRDASIPTTTNSTATEPTTNSTTTSNSTSRNSPIYDNHMIQFQVMFVLYLFTWVFPSFYHKQSAKDITIIFPSVHAWDIIVTFHLLK